jgi:hypothetical protein
MLKDKQDNKVSGANAQAVTLFDGAIAAFNIYRGDPVALLDQAIDAAPDFAMAYIAKAHMFASTSEPAALQQAAELIGSVWQLKLNDRERSHVSALAHLFEGEWTQAALTLDRHSMRWPHDLLALQSGHLIDFFRGNARNLRDRIARALPAWSPDMPGYSILLGMHAFGLEECGDYARAEEQGRRAVELQALDCWAHHAVTHVMEMQCRSEDGIGWMIAREPYWSGDDNGFKVHNWWHRALFHLNLDQKDEALALYDGPVREDRSALALDMVDASSLLWRLHLADIDVGCRWQELSATWDRHADGTTYPFNDWHAAMAYLGAGRDEELDRVLSALRKTAADNSETGRWAREFGLPLIEGFAAFWRGDFAIAAERLYPARFIANAFGGSHAQRDIIDLTLTEAALRGGLDDLAGALVNERRMLKPHGRINSGFRSRIAGRAKDARRAA